MIKVVSVENMRLIEAAANAAGLTYDQMMENAGRATAERALMILNRQDDARVTILVGPGNNGGDGLVAGRIIAEQSSALVRFYLLKKRSDDDPLLQAVRDAGLLIADAEDDQRYRVLHHMVGSAHLLIDALFGIGIRLPIQGDAAKLLQSVQRALNELRTIPSKAPTITPTQPTPHSTKDVPYILAVDCPSGIDCDTGALDANTIAADETITFIAAKPGLLTFPGAGAVGQLSLSTIDIPDDLKELQDEKWLLIDDEAAHARLPPRPPNSHKGTYGKALIIAGSDNYVGAPGMAAQAAYRAGAGLVTVAAPQNIVNSLSVRLYEPTWLPLTPENALQKIQESSSSYDALLIGPGWGQEDTTRRLLAELLHNKNLPPLVIDADGLNLLAQMDQWWKLLPQKTILTPHPGEMARLSSMDTQAVQENRWALATRKAAEWNVILVLKGAHTLIAQPDGQVAALPFKTDALAKAGTGDVLAGVITGLLAQGIEPFKAAVAGGYLHGLAGEQAAIKQGSSRSVMAGDVIEALGQAFHLLEA